MRERPSCAERGVFVSGGVADGGGVILDWAGLGSGDMHCTYPSAKVHVEVAVEDPVGLGGVEVPDQLAVREGGSGGHHLSIISLFSALLSKM